MFLAKSNPKESIQEHTDNLLKNYNLLYEIYKNKLDINWSMLKVVCLYHDLGKMNEIFQNKIKRKPSKIEREEIPHGFLSVGFIDVYALLEIYSEEELAIIVTAIAQHHIRDFNLEEKRSDLSDEIYRLKDIVKKFYYEKLPNIGEYVEDYAVDLIYSKELREFENLKDRINYIKIKGLLNRIDYAASGYYKIEYKNDFLMDSMDEMVAEVWRKKDKKADYNNLQKYMKNNQEENIIAIAETGYGKTEAGLLWIGNNKGFFTLPLRSAINSIYDRISLRILQKKKLDERLALLHSDSLNELFNRTDNIKKEDSLSFEDIEILDYDDRARQKSLPLTVSTIDQIFKFVYKYRGFEQELATLSYSKIVIDEIQMYSPDLLAYLIIGLDMITKVGGKFSIITATLPPFILDLLDERNVKYKMPASPYYNIGRIRHCMELKQEQINALFIKDKYKNNKVLVIVNTVKKAQELYYDLIEAKIDEEETNVFHGGFIRKDRKEVEEKIIEFGNRDKNNKPGIWICTQVAEASLDIDFDILITELSDINGLFQRMGRCYRKRELDGEDSNVFVFDGGEELCSGIGFVNDEEIFKMSRNKLRDEFRTRVFWKINEEDKLNIINDIYTMENMSKTKYLEDTKNAIDYIEKTFPYEFSKNDVIKMFRSINNIDVIPREIYEKNEKEIRKCIDIIREKNIIKENVEERKKQRVEKNKARIFISDLTVSIPFYFSNYDNTISKKITDYESINIYECQYDNKFGIQHTKGKIKENYRDTIDERMI
ncbi:MAG: CRISPR-associated helicase Cas3' [Miniphocaeibacter sp.]|uniref:CRISPR-associated helicase Cas3' n=1 Tax=Miniphocaeibacter sp. TaxID=3100973 RepID=UPI00181A1344|nr:CRISPR-associated helicase Cas3' [Gallicola sp.]